MNTAEKLVKYLKPIYEDEAHGENVEKLLFELKNDFKTGELAAKSKEATKNLDFDGFHKSIAHGDWYVFADDSALRVEHDWTAYSNWRTIFNAPEVELV